MKKLLEVMLEDMSTRDVFLFRVACDACGAEFGNKPVRFSKAGITPRTPEKTLLYDAVYEQEFRSAKLSSIRDAAEQLNYCPICKRLVCNRCFLICDDLDMCKQCATQLDEMGTPVFSDILESAV